MTIYYVDAVNGSDAAAGTFGAPWQTAAKVSAATLSSGDVVLFTAGQTFPGSFSAQTGVRYGKWGVGADPIIDAAGVDVGVTLPNVSATVVEDLDVRDWRRRGVHVLSGADCVLRRLAVSGGDGTAGAANHGIRAWSNGGDYVQRLRVEGCTIGPIASGTAATNAQTQGIFFVGVLLQDCDDFVVEDCRFETVKAVSAWATISNTSLRHSQSGRMSRNEMVNCTTGPMIHYADDVIFEDNHVHDGHGFGVGYAFFAKRGIIRRNVIHDLTRRTGDVLWNGVDLSNGCTGVAYQNTIFRVVRHCVVLASDFAGADEWEWYHNILDASENTPYTVSDFRVLPIADRTGRDQLNEHDNILHAYDQPIINLATNPRFETFTGTADDGTTDTFTGWTNTLNSGGVIEAVTAAAADFGGAPMPAGMTYAAANKPGSSGIQSLRQDVTLTGGVEYEFSFKTFYKQVAVDPGSIVVYVTRGGTVYCQSDGVTWTDGAVNAMVTTTNDAAWNEYTFTFTPDINATYRIIFYDEYRRGRSYFTDVHLSTSGQPTGRFVGSNGLDQGTMYDIAGWQAAGFGVGSRDVDPRTVRMNGDTPPTGAIRQVSVDEMRWAKQSFLELRGTELFPEITVSGYGP